MAPLFTVPLADIERNDVSIQWPIPAEWLDQQLADTEAKSQGKNGQLTAHLARNGREILVQAKAQVQVVMPCARTLDPVPLTLEPEIYLLLAPRSGQPRPGPTRPELTRSGPARAKARGEGLPGTAAKKSAGRGRLHQDEDDPGELLSEQDAARDTFEGDQIVLDGFIREHIVLELPLFPLRSDLRSEDSPAIRPPQAAASAERAVDPRLMPLMAIAKKLRESKE